MAIYLDHAATTPMTARVLDAYTGALGLVGNPSSIHGHGQVARRMLEEAREQVASALGADAVEITFTSGGTESVNLAVKGLWWARNPTGETPVGAGAAATARNGRRSKRERARILVPRGEHHATIDAVEWLERHEGAVVEWLPIDDVGRLDLAALERALGDDVALLTLLWANNEVGTVQPIAEAVALANRHGVPVHVDAVGAFGAVPIDFRGSGLAAMSVSAHKLGGPVGIGALAIARSATVEPLIHGGNQQRARSGTQDVAGAVGFGVAAQDAMRLDSLDAVAALRDRLIAGVGAAIPDATLRGDPRDRLPGNAHFTFPGAQGDSLLYLLDAAGISVSAGSACQAGVPEPSHVLLAMGVAEAEASSALRITLGHGSTESDVDAFLAALPAAVERARAAGLSGR